MSTWTSISKNLEHGKRSGRAALRRRHIERHKRAKGVKYSSKKSRVQN